MTMSEFREIVSREFLKLHEVVDYLNEAGIAKMEAFREVDQAAAFCNSLKDLYEWDYYKELCDIPNQHPEYYRVLRMINRRLEKEVN